MALLTLVASLLSMIALANENHTFPKPVLELIQKYAQSSGWYTQNQWDGYNSDKVTDGLACDQYETELKHMLVPNYMNAQSLSALLRFIDKTQWETHTHRKTDDHPWKKDGGHRDYESNARRAKQNYREAKEKFRNSSFKPSDNMIHNLEHLARSLVWRPVWYRNAQARHQTKAEIDAWVDHYSKKLTATDLEILKIDFNSDNALWTEQSPESTYLGTVSCDARASEPQRLNFTFTTSQMHQNSFSTTFGSKLGFSYKGSASLFDIVKFETGVSIEFSYSTTESKMKANTQSTAYSVPCVAAPGERVRCKAIWKKAAVDVPYTITYKIDKNKKELKGIWKGVMTYESDVSNTVLNRENTQETQ